MTCGIYRLTFTDTLFYIGKSDNIERRYKQHIYYLNKGVGTNKMVQAYLSNNTPTLEILELCSVATLDTKEVLWIKDTNAISSLNSTEGGDGAARGDLNPKAKYSNKVIEECLDYILNNPTTSLKAVSEMLNVSYTTVQNLANGSLYKWLQEKRPEDYAKLKSLKGNRYSISGRKLIHVMVLDPQGTVHIVKCISEFADSWKLDRSNFGKVIRGQIPSCKGWKLHEENKS